MAPREQRGRKRGEIMRQKEIWRESERDMKTDRQRSMYVYKPNNGLPCPLKAGIVNSVSVLECGVLGRHNHCYPLDNCCIH